MRANRILSYLKWLLPHLVNFGLASVIMLAVSPAMTGEFAQAQAGGAIVGERLTTSAEVEAINLDKRLVTLKAKDGESFTVKVGEAVQNLPQVKVGDTVEVDYYEAVALDVSKPKPGSAPGVSVTEEAVRAKKGELPAGAEAEVITYTSQIVGINRPQSTLTVMGADDQIYAIKVQDPKAQQLLENELKVGDMVHVSFVEAVAVAVKPKG